MATINYDALLIEQNIFLATGLISDIEDNVANMIITADSADGNFGENDVISVIVDLVEVTNYLDTIINMYVEKNGDGTYNALALKSETEIEEEDATILKRRIKHKAYLASQWDATTILLDREIGFETDTGKYKIGNGITPWGHLAYANTGKEGLTAKDIDNKVDKEEGKGLSTNDFSDENKIKLNGIEEGAQKNINIFLHENGKTPISLLNKNLITIMNQGEIYTEVLCPEGSQQIMLNPKLSGNFHNNSDTYIYKCNEKLMTLTGKQKQEFVFTIPNWENLFLDNELQYIFTISSLAMWSSYGTSPLWTEQIVPLNTYVEFEKLNNTDFYSFEIYIDDNGNVYVRANKSYTEENSLTCHAFMIKAFRGQVYVI